LAGSDEVGEVTFFFAFRLSFRNGSRKKEGSSEPSAAKGGRATGEGKDTGRIAASAVTADGELLIPL